jgi:predicted DNA-binding WGR domain protein
MKVSVACFAATAETSDSALQMTKIFDSTLASLAREQADFTNSGGLSIDVSISHPIMPKRQRGRRSYSNSLRTYFVSVPVDYTRWVSNSWVTRTDAFADTAKEGIARVPSSRITDAERLTLNDLIEQTRWRVRRSPPAKIEPVNSIFVLGDASNGPPQIFFAPPISSHAGYGRFAEVRPEDAQSFAREAVPNASVEQVLPFKLYQRIEGRLHYHEAWKAERTIVEHWGLCGERGQVREHAFAEDSWAGELIRKLKNEARARGFRQIPPSRHATLVVEYSVDGLGSADDLERRHAIENFLNEQTGWLGLGHCDGGSSGSGTMEVFCIVVDFEVAKVSLARELSRSPFGGFRRIYRMA